MAIAFARARYITRSSGGNSVRSAAYNARENIRAERTAETLSFKHRDAPIHHEVLLPAGANPSLGTAAALWNAAENAERRKDSQIAREIVLALPADREMTHDDRVELTRSFAKEHFVAKGLAVQIDIHEPHDGDAESDTSNHHAHLLITTRRIEGDHLAAKKARDLDPEIKAIGGRPIVTDGDLWGELWRDHQNRYFAGLGLSNRVDATSAIAQDHIGPIRMRTPGNEAGLTALEIASANLSAARDPAVVLAALTRNEATFTIRDVERYLAKHVPDAGERIVLRDQVLGHADVLALHDKRTGELVERFTTVQVREQEREALVAATEVSLASHHRGLDMDARDIALASRTLRPDQRASFDYATSSGGLKVIEGRAGTGKSYTLQAVREAYEQAGYSVIGLAPTNAIAQDLKSEGFKQGGTLHSELFRIKNGRTTWSDTTVVIVDEASMLDTPIVAGLMVEARRAGAKVILAGDDRQLAAVERGGLFTEFRERHGSAEITQVTRQKVDWQRQAAQDLSVGQFHDAIRAFAKHKAITWTDKQDETIGALVECWRADTASDPTATRFVFAYTNKDVDALNAALRQVRVERGEIEAGRAFETKHGPAEFSVGDRIQFTDTLKRAKIYNGNAGVITAIDEKSGRIRATLDGPSGQSGRTVDWNAFEFQGFRHGYAGTIYKGQGKTLDHTYLLHTHHWRSSASYVALTRQRLSAQVFVAVETARDLNALARQIGRASVKAASVAYSLPEELPLALRPKADTRRVGETTAEEPPRTTAALPTPLESAASARPAEAWVPAYVSPDGRDSRGRDLDRRSVAAAVDADPHVAREREEQAAYLHHAYRDPDAAKRELDVLVARDGALSAGRRIAAEPASLGELRGLPGVFAGSAARAERVQAERMGGAIAANLERVAGAEGAAERAYRMSVAAQREADATPIPRLSDKAEKAVETIARATSERARAAAWTMASTDPEVATELKAFRSAAEKRFGEDGLRTMVRASAAGQPVDAPSVSAEAKPALAEVAKAAGAIKAGEQAAQTTARATERERLGSRSTLRS